MEFRKVADETQYFRDPFEAPARRRQTEAGWFLP
jgi:hypothetical protein